MLEKTGTYTRALRTQTGWQPGRASLRIALTAIAALALTTAAPVAAESVTTLDAGQGVIHMNAPRSEADMRYSMEIESGKSASIKTSYSVKRVSVGNPGVLEVVVLGGREIQLVTKDVGSTNLLIWDANGRPQAIIDVEVGTAHSQVESALRRAFGNETIEVASAGHAVVLKGNVASTMELDQTINLASALLGRKKGDGEIVSLLEVGGNHQVMLKVVVAEMSRTLNREFGTNFAALIETGSGTVAIGSFVQGIATPISGGAIVSDMAELFGTFAGFGSLELLEVFLDVLDERGLSKILAKPTLVARSGESASFLVGGEIPIPVAQGGAFGSITVEYKDFGVGLSFTPTVLAEDRIHLRVNPEVSRADFTFGTEVAGTIVPGFLSRRAATSVELADGQSFMIAGLLSDQVRELAGKYPLLGDIPILGSLFRSTQFQKEETELVIIVTPTLVRPLGPGPHPLPTDNFIEPTDVEFYLWGMLEGDPNRHPDAASSQQDTGGMIGANGYRVSTTFDGEIQ